MIAEIAGGLSILNALKPEKKAPIAAVEAPKVAIPQAPAPMEIAPAETADAILRRLQSMNQARG